MKKIVSIALAIALICFMIASTAFANETAVLKVETTTTSVQQGENVVIKTAIQQRILRQLDLMWMSRIVLNMYLIRWHLDFPKMQYIQTAQEPLAVITDSFQEILRL